MGRWSELRLLAQIDRFIFILTINSVISWLVRSEMKLWWLNVLNGSILLLNFESLNLWMSRFWMKCRFFEKFSIVVDKNGMSLFIFLWTFQTLSIQMMVYMIFLDLIAFDLLRYKKFLLFLNYMLFMNLLDL